GGAAPPRRFVAARAGPVRRPGADAGVRRRGGRGGTAVAGPAGQRRGAGGRGVGDGGRHGRGGRGAAGPWPAHGGASAAVDPPDLGERGGPMSQRVFQDEALPLSLSLRVDEVCWRFEMAWKAVGTGSEPPRLEAYLAEVEEPARAVLLRELLQVE